MTPAVIRNLIAQGESETLEFKKSTAELRETGKKPCTFLNGDGGQVLIGVAPNGKAIGQHVSDSTLRDISAMLGRLLEMAAISRSLQELMKPTGRTDRTKFRDQVVAPPLEAGLFEMTIPYKPRSSRQRERSTAEGMKLIEKKSAST